MTNNWMRRVHDWHHGDHRIETEPVRDPYGDAIANILIWEWHPRRKRDDQ